MRRLRRSLALLLAACMLALALGTLIPRPLWPEAFAGPVARKHILVLKNPIHTDIVIPLDDGVRQRFRFLADTGVAIDNPDMHHIIFGLGGRAFYIETPTWMDLKPLPMMKALTVDVSVMHVDLSGHIVEPQPDVEGFNISEDRFTALLDFIAASFQQGPNGPIVIENAGYGRFDRFYEANGFFNALVGCNIWTAAALRSAGLRTGWWNPLPASLSLSMWLYNSRQTMAPGL